MAKIIDSGSILNLEHQKKYVKSPTSWAAYMADLAVWFKEDEQNPDRVRDTIIAYIKRCPHVLDDEVLAKSVIQGHLDAPLDLSRTGLHHVVRHLQARLQVL